MKEPDALRGGDGIVGDVGEEIGRNLEKKRQEPLYTGLGWYSQVDEG